MRELGADTVLLSCYWLLHPTAPAQQCGGQVAGCLPAAPAAYTECRAAARMNVLQGVADAAAAELGLEDTSGRLGPKALLACVLLAEAAAEEQLRAAGGGHLDGAQHEQQDQEKEGEEGPRQQQQ